MEDEVLVGAVGDIVITLAGLWVGFVGLILAGLAYLILSITNNTKADFIQAKLDGKSISCTGLLKTYNYSANAYTVTDKQVVIKKMLKDKKHYIADCRIL